MLSFTFFSFRFVTITFLTSYCENNLGVFYVSKYETKWNNFNAKKRQKNAKFYFHIIDEEIICGYGENAEDCKKKIDELNLSEKTLIIFTSDNGGIRDISDQFPLALSLIGLTFAPFNN